MYVALTNLKHFRINNNIHKLTMNKLGQLNKIKWDKVRAMIRYIFRYTDIEIISCSGVTYTEEKKLIILEQFLNFKLAGHLGINKTIKRIKTAL